MKLCRSFLVTKIYQKKRIKISLNMTRFLFFWFGLFHIVSCKNSETVISQPQPQNYLTKNVVVIVVDGPRYSETWGEPSHQYIPFLAQKMAPAGVINTEFYN